MNYPISPRKFSHGNSNGRLFEEPKHRINVLLSLPVDHLSSDDLFSRSLVRGIKCVVRFKPEEAIEAYMNHMSRLYLVPNGKCVSRIGLNVRKKCINIKREYFAEQ